ncbi:MAG TPA: metallophosphoesterase family protein [Kineosporiaceae bacterium]|nr:metallophosphoesterase family protein [Kineosporiaceae bacterium]
MRVAVLADIHGNLPALEAVLAEVDAAGVDAVVINGDMTFGPMPAETLDRLAELGDRAVWVHGNCEREVLTALGGSSDPDLPDQVRVGTEYTAAQLKDRHRKMITDLPLSVVLEVQGLGPVRFAHATTRDDAEMVLVDSPLQRFRECFDNTQEATVVLGHTHMPFDRLADRRRFVNPGSVGMAYGSDGALWALLGPDVVLRRTRYDTEAAAATLRRRAADYPGLDDFITGNLLTVPSDAEALAFFSATAPHEGP